MIERDILMAEILAAVGMVKTFTPGKIKMMPENHTIEKENLLGQWPNFELFGITYLVGKIEFKLLFQGSIR